MAGLLSSAAIAGMSAWRAEAGEVEDSDAQGEDTVRSSAEEWFLTPSGAGDRSGTGLANAAPFRRISQLAENAEPGATFRISVTTATEPLIWSGQQMQWSRSGTPNAKFLIAFDSPENPVEYQQDSNTPPAPRYVLEGNDVSADGRLNVGGAPFLVLGPESSHLTLTGPVYHRSGGNGFFRLEADGTVQDLTFSNIHATRASRVIESERGTSVEGLVVKDCSAVGLIRGFARFFELSDAEFRNLDLDADYLDGGGGAVCQIISVVAGRDLDFRNIRLAKAVNLLAAEERGSPYIQGDGIVLEEETANVTIEDCHAEDMGDGGFDLKTQGVQLRRCTTVRCKLGIRIWSHNPANTMDACIMTDPVSRPDNDGSCLWLAGMLTGTDCELRARTPRTAPIRFGNGNDNSLGAALVLRGGLIEYDESAELVVGSPGQIELENVTINGYEESGRYDWNGRSLRRI
ncbi:MAG: hypothetical protein ACSHW1_17955 [Yoonia sp.]|uniref:hypothetical protein n=1 Tax=Yoonia sp. TaxID=2212373 RepID=UPI003EF43E85